MKFFATPIIAVVFAAIGNICCAQTDSVLMPIPNIDSIEVASPVATDYNVKLVKDMEKELVITQLNYCINSLTNIIHNKSVVVLEREIDQLINNLTMEQIVGMYEIASFRSELLEQASALQITEEERKILRRVNQIKKDNAMWQSLSSALNPAMLVTGGGNMGPQVAFQALLTVARTAVEFKTAQGEMTIEELQAMWALRKSDMQSFADLRKSALDLTFKLYQRYNLSESDRLTEQTSTLFSEIISTYDPSKRVRLLLDNSVTYEHISDYYYYLGMAYIDQLGADGYEKAISCFDRYLTQYRRSPIFRIDDKTGCIALAKLTYDKNLSENEIQTLIDEVLTNLPKNGAALMQCAILYIRNLDKPEVAYDLLRSGIDRSDITDKDAIVYMISELLPQIKNYPAIYQDICNAMQIVADVSLDSYLTFVISDNNDVYNKIAKIVGIEQAGWFWQNSKYNLTISNRYNYDITSTKVYIEEINKKKNKISIYSCDTKYDKGIEKETLLDKVSCFNANPDLMYLFVNTLVEGEVYAIKNGLDYSKIQSGNMPELYNYTLTDSDLKDIVKFCKKHECKDLHNIINCKKDAPIFAHYTKKDNCLYFDAAFIEDGNSSILSAVKSKYEDLCGEQVFTLKYVGDNLYYTPTPFYNQDGRYIKVMLDNPSNAVLCYSFGSEGVELYSVEVNGVIHFKEAQVITYPVLEEDAEEKDNNTKDIDQETSGIWGWCAKLWNSIF